MAAFNAGVYQFFMPQDVLNLDGVVNPSVQPYLRSRDLCPYLRDHNITWILDSENGLRKLTTFGGRTQIVETTPLGGSVDPQFLWRIKTEC